MQIQQVKHNNSSKENSEEAIIRKEELLNAEANQNFKAAKDHSRKAERERATIIIHAKEWGFDMEMEEWTLESMLIATLRVAPHNKFEPQARFGSNISLFVDHILSQTIMLQQQSSKNEGILGNHACNDI